MALESASNVDTSATAVVGIADVDGGDVLGRCDDVGDGVAVGASDAVGCGLGDAVGCGLGHSPTATPTASSAKSP